MDERHSDCVHGGRVVEGGIKSVDSRSAESLAAVYAGALCSLSESVVQPSAFTAASDFVVSSINSEMASGQEASMRQQQGTSKPIMNKI